MKGPAIISASSKFLTQSTGAVRRLAVCMADLAQNEMLGHV